MKMLNIYLLTNINPNYLQSVEFDLDKIIVDSNLESIILKSDILIVAVPVAFIHKHFRI